MTITTSKAMTKADAITALDSLTSRMAEMVPAMVTEWTPEAVSAMSADDLTERVHAIVTTDRSMGDLLMVAGALTVWGAYLREHVGEGKVYPNGKALAEALGKSEGYVSKARRFGRAYAEYGVEPGTTLWSRIISYDLPKSVREELGKSPEVVIGKGFTPEQVAAVRDRWSAEIDAHLTPADDNSGEGTGDESVPGEVLSVSDDTSPVGDVERIVETLRTLLTGATGAGDTATLEALLTGCTGIASEAADALATITASVESA